MYVYLMLLDCSHFVDLISLLHWTVAAAQSITIMIVHVCSDGGNRLLVRELQLLVLLYQKRMGMIGMRRWMLLMRLLRLDSRGWRVLLLRLMLMRVKGVALLVVG